MKSKFSVYDLLELKIIQVRLYNIFKFKNKFKRFYIN